MSDTNLATVEPIDKPTKPARKPRKSGGRGTAKTVQPSPVEAFQVLAWRDEFGPTVRAQEDYKKVIDLLVLAVVEPDPVMPPAIIAGLSKGFPTLAGAVQSGDDELRAIVNGVA